MSYADIYAIASQGMSLEKLRVDIVANNIANQHTLLSKDGSGFQPMRIEATAKPFSTYLNNIEEAGLQSDGLVNFWLTI